jgi:DNA-binding response OmpR family regulator
MNNNKILVIENDQDHLIVIRAILSPEGVQVFESTPDRVLSAIDNIYPSLILIDNWLDYASGAEICKQLKTNMDTKNIPVILMSACMGLKKIAEDCKADGYLEKPFEIEDLSETVKYFSSQMVGR